MSPVKTLHPQLCVQGQVDMGHGVCGQRQNGLAPAMRCRKPAVTPAGTNSQYVSSRLPRSLTASARTAGAASPRASPKAANCRVSTSSVSLSLASGSYTHTAKA